MEYPIGFKNIVHVKHISNPEDTPWLDWIESGKKTYEGRLNKDFWRSVCVGDKIFFYSQEKSVLTIVEDKNFYIDFVAAFEDLKDKLVPIEGISSEKVRELYSEFYPDDQIKEHGVVAVKVKVITEI